MGILSNQNSKTMKNSLLFILITFSCTSCFAQSVEGLYKDMLSSSFVCVKNDSISIAYKRSEYDGPCYYYGTYRIVNDTILLGGNLLRHKNAIVDTVYTDYSGFEIQLFEQYPDIPMGAPVNHFSTSFQQNMNFKVWWNYELDCKGLLFWRTQPNRTAIDGLIQIPIDTSLTHCSANEEFLIQGYGFFTEQCLEIRPHVRYVIKQKDYNQNYRPMVPQEVPVVYDSRKNQFEITESSTINNQPRRTFQLKYIGPTDSCFGELLKQYPNL
jgi:hypothetical protein